MHIELLYDYCLALPYTTESFPFDSNTLVFKVKNKMFALTDVSTFESINIKCDADIAIALREKYSSVLPGYHMNKNLWNTVLIDGSINDKLLLEWVRDSYNLVVAGLNKKEQADVNASLNKL
jgi:predicted DNA-binding protein (MmcQ/YjbR family)